MRRRGAAMLVVLAILVVVGVACAGVARLATTASLARRTQSRAEACQDLLHAAAAPIARWLQRESHSAIVPPDATEPAVAVLRDAWVASGAPCSLVITAFDQLGMIPLSHAHGGSPLAHVLPRDLEGAARQLLDARSPGLDLIEADVPVYPAARAELLRSHGAQAIAPQRSAREEPTAVGAILATHNPPDLGRRRAGAVNVNTAPLHLLEPAMRLAGRSGVEQIIETRTQGKPARVPTGAGRPQTQDLEIVGVSTTWSFRIDAGVGQIRRSWWAVYTRTPSGWTCVQRLEIDR